MKNQLDWKADYDLGVELLDTQHREAFAIARKILSSDGPDQIRKGLSELYCHTLNHFAEEERYMRSIGYPRSEEHSCVHDELVLKLNELMQSVSRNSSKLPEIGSFLAAYLTDHILDQDKKITSFAEQNQVDSTVKDF